MHSDELRLSLTEEEIKQFIFSVWDMRNKQKKYFESRKKAGNNKHLLEAAVKAEMEVDGALWKIEKNLCLEDVPNEEPERSLF